MTELQEKSEIRARRRQAILRAAAEEFCQKGFDHTRMDAIAVRAGIGKSTIYEYFPSKILLLNAVCEDIYTNVHAEINKIFAQEIPFRNKMVQYVRFLGNILISMGEKLLEFRDESETMKMLGNIGQQYVRQMQAELLTQLSDAQASGEVRSDIDPVATTALLLSIPNILYHHRTLSAERMLDLLFQGVGA